MAGGHPHAGAAYDHTLALAVGGIGQIAGAQFEAVFRRVVLAIYHVAGGGDLHGSLAGDEDGVCAVPVFQLAAVGIVAFVVHFLPPVHDLFGGGVSQVDRCSTRIAAIAIVGQFGAHVRHPLFEEPAVQRPGNAVLSGTTVNDGFANRQHVLEGLGRRFGIQPGLAEDILVVIEDWVGGVPRHGVELAVELVVVGNATNQIIGIGPGWSTVLIGRENA